MIDNYLYELLKNEYDSFFLNKIIEGYNNKRKTTIRINKIKTTIDKIKTILNTNKIIFNISDISEDALIIINDDFDKIKKLDIYKNGEIYFQSLSSQMPPLVLNPQENEQILDMAASPGGKTSQIASITNNKAMITACEKDKIRFERLKYNIEKQNVKRINLMNIDSLKLDDYFKFDKILLDAPCSGSGTYLINEKFNKDTFLKIQEIQKRLLQKAIKIIKPGGTIIYSTCSILKEENDRILDIILSENKNIVLEKINCFDNIDLPLLPCKYKETICLYPNSIYEGFFIAKLKKL